MITVRTVRESDIEGVLNLAKQAFPGMTTLPPNRAVLASKLKKSVESINKRVQTPNDEAYFLVMEDSDSNAIIGTSAILACLGSVDEFYSYKLNKVTHSCKELDKKITVETLNLSNHFEGFAEVATLYLNPAYRKNGNGKLLARSRYLFMAQFRQRFPERVMADLRGYFDDNGCSPFWEAVGQHFFDMPFSDADLYGAINGNQFIADLMPKHPLYVNMLPRPAQAVIGQPNVKGKPALSMLKQEGFRWNGHVDIFDAAPSVDTKIDDIISIKNSLSAPVIDIQKNSMTNIGGANQHIAVIANSDIRNFSACVAMVSVEEGGIRLPSSTLQALNIEVGDSVRYLLN